MGALFVYILKVSFCLTLFYLFFKLLLSKETFYRFNRIALLCLFALSLLIPFIEVSLSKTSQLHYVLAEFEQLIDPQVTSSENIAEPLVPANFINAALLVYVLGLIFFFIRNLYSFLRIYLLIRKHESEEYNDVKIISHSLNIAPFSWMNYVVVSETDLAESRNEILTHELSHIKHYHSVDLLFAELCVIIQWFNPAAWLMKKELQTIHEYEADSSVINSGIDAKSYQLLLIKKAVGTLRFTSMTNSFNHSKLKKRITMMLKEKSNPWAMAKYLYAVPLVMLSVTLFARPEISTTLDEISNAKFNEISLISEDTITTNWRVEESEVAEYYYVTSSDTTIKISRSTKKKQAPASPKRIKDEPRSKSEVKKNEIKEGKAPAPPQKQKDTPRGDKKVVIVKDDVPETTTVVSKPKKESENVIVEDVEKKITSPSKSETNIIVEKADIP